ncbi:hypothetical protein M513_07724 [Trichuris suis]|uniref:Uncharacterized protein n=1 Tax=Trichuris suis TaxID=68888 RepID=A0A085M273_9BILA|nr:hypothetical protein M513_07724 [Trichuris suis]
MNKASDQSCVVVEHASHCSLDPRPKVVCRESQFHLRCIKEVLYIKSNSTINRKNGVAASEMNERMETKRVNIDILGVSESNWIGAGEFSSGDLYIYYCGHESIKRNGVAL